VNKNQVKKFVESLKRDGGVIATKDPHYISILKHFLKERLEVTEDMMIDISQFKKVDYFINFSNTIDLADDHLVFNNLYIV